MPSNITTENIISWLHSSRWTITSTEKQNFDNLKKTLSTFPLLSPVFFLTRVTLNVYLPLPSSANVLRITHTTARHVSHSKCIQRLLSVYLIVCQPSCSCSDCDIIVKLNHSPEHSIILINYPYSIARFYVGLEPDNGLAVIATYSQ